MLIILFFVCVNVINKVITLYTLYWYLTCDCLVYITMMQHFDCCRQQRLMFHILCTKQVWIYLLS